MRTLLVVALSLSFASPLFAQDRPDFQMRIPQHFQIAEREASTGLAAWAILPDATAPANRWATLVLAGLLRQSKTKGRPNWLELMGGTRVNQNGFVDPMFNLRLLNNHIPHLTISGEIQQTFRAERRRFLWWLATDTPIGIGLLRAGVETENITFFGKRTSLGVGPRLSLPLPLRLPQSMKILVATTYQVRNDQNFLRLYIVTNFSAKK